MYKVWRNKINSIIRISKKNYFNKAIKDKSDTKFLWQNLRNTTTSDDNEHRVPNKFLINNSEIEGAQNINVLNNHFVNICNIINKTSVNSKYINDLKIYLDRKLSNRHFEVKFISPLEVKNIIDKLHSTNSTGNDRIGPKIFKMCRDFISQPIASILNSCISMSIFLSEFKKACVTPLYKGGDKNDPIIDLYQFCQLCQRCLRGTLLISLNIFLNIQIFFFRINQVLERIIHVKRPLLD